MARPSGLGEANPLARKTSKSKIISSLTTAQQPDSSVATADLAHNPFNPPGRSDTGVDLAASLGAVGVLNPLVVVDRATWLTANPGHETSLGAAAWVVIDGNRRLAGARAAGLAEVPIHVRSARPQDLTEQVLLHANLHRLLSPVEEAVLYERVVQTHGLTQRDLAATLGVSQSHVAKRISLLRLSDEVLQLILQEKLGTKAALLLVGEDERVQVRAAKGIVDQGWVAESAIRRARTELSIEDAEELALVHRATVEQYAPSNMVEVTESDLTHDVVAGARLVVIPAQPEGAAGPTLGLVPPASETSSTSTEDRQAKQEDRERVHAAKTRERHLHELVESRPRAADFTALLQRVVVREGGLNSAVSSLAVRVLQATGAAEDWAKEGWALRDHAATAVGPERARLAWLIGLCIEEMTVREHREWRAADAEYLGLLQATGYVPTEWELKRLAALESIECEEEQS